MTGRRWSTAFLSICRAMSGLPAMGHGSPGAEIHQRRQIPDGDWPSIESPNEQQGHDDSGRPAGIDIDKKTNELYIADGYGDRRVIVFDAATGEFKRLWGAYGNPPVDGPAVPYNPSAPPSQQFGAEVHCVHVSSDGFAYVCDRLNDRIQMFNRGRASS